MAQDRSTVRPATARGRDLPRVLAIAIALVALMLAATAVFGWHGMAAPFDITPDPAGSMPF